RAGDGLPAGATVSPRYCNRGMAALVRAQCARRRGGGCTRGGRAARASKRGHCMRVLVTGSAGKLGQWVVRELKAHRHDVTSFDRVRGPEAADRDLIGDIEDPAAVADAVRGADAILHLAGIRTHGLVPDDETFRINVMGALNVHEAARRADVHRVVSMSS